jgi:hypothetical protein|tara:strand:+ start:766 stop:975 length:210 start_codon:yes stop_codon:yes gene_type:complete
MQEIIAPTDSRWRKDQRHFEEGDIEQADKEKTILQKEQNKRIECWVDPQGNFFDYDKANESRWQPRFFK